MNSDHFFFPNHTPFRMLLADDDEDDQFFFEDVLTKFKFDKQLTILDDGEKLLRYLFQEKQILPDVLFLDCNLPRKNGEECLIAIKKHSALKDLPVIMYSTYLDDDVADILYKAGAHFFVRKTDSKSLVKILHKVFTLLIVQKALRPERQGFIITV